MAEYSPTAGNTSCYRIPDKECVVGTGIASTCIEMSGEPGVKICVASTGREISSRIAPLFGRAPFFLFAKGPWREAVENPYRESIFIVGLQGFMF